MQTTKHNEANTTDALQYKCPHCGGSVVFNSSTQRMKCPYCDSEFDVSEAISEDSPNREKAKEAAREASFEWGSYGKHSGNGDWKQGERENIRRYICQSCGGEVITDSETAATACPYCDNPVVLADQLEGIFKPDLVIPFRLDKNAAKQSFTDHLKGKKLLPNAFKSEAHIDEIKGVYVPFWLFNCTAGAYSEFRATKVSTWSDSEYRYTKTNYYELLRSGSADFAALPADASEKMDDILMEAIEPFDLSDAKDFNTAYLSGYLAEKYSVVPEKCRDRINQRIVSSMASLINSTISGYSTCTTSRTDYNTSNNSINYALFPVWILNTDYKGKHYTFAMNGQTGKFVGDLPIDKGKMLRRFLCTFGICSAVLSAITLLSVLSL